MTLPTIHQASVGCASPAHLPTAQRRALSLVQGVRRQGPARPIPAKGTDRQMGRI
jgi:hypothetical protein